MRQFRDFDISIQPVQLSGGQGRAGGGYAAGIPVIVIKGPGIISDGLAELETSYSDSSCAADSWNESSAAADRTDL